ncbi:MAG TPA: glycyl-radical enzyme activating protein [Syntrophorhabdaceae bacterium]|nr:glycyl-radical enzyme activating protein [Syntrophorhabdaceae bacterium]
MGDEQTNKSKQTNGSSARTKGAVFNIQRYSIHDGPGIRTTVFLKGCPLACLWCQNPESQLMKPQIFYNAERCVGCGRCITVCPVKAIAVAETKVKTDRELCTGCGTCIETCPEEARELVGKTMTVEEVVEEVMKDDIFYQRSGGGITISGGEPFTQPFFSAGILKLCKERNTHTAIETCGYAPWETVEKVLDYTDLVLFDIKHIVSQVHMRLTGVPNELILENAKRIWHERHIPMWIRVPVIPGCNDSTDNIEALATFVVNELSPFVQLHLLPYHRLGESKVQQLEQSGTGLVTDPPDENHMQLLKEVMEAKGMRKVLIGG